MAELPQRIGDVHLMERPADAAWPWPVYRGGEGTPVLVLHEVFGLTPEVLAFATTLIRAGFSAWLPVLARPVPSDGWVDGVRAITRVCVSREFTVLATGRTSRVVEPLRALARFAAAEAAARTATDSAAQATPVARPTGVGVVGMCPTGSFALGMAADESVLASVVSQPSLPVPVPFTPCARDLGVSDEHLDDVRDRMTLGAVEVLYLRFSADPIRPKGRLRTARDRLVPDRLLVDEIPSGRGNPHGYSCRDHSVLTAAPEKHAGRPGRDRLAATMNEVVAFLQRRLT